VKKYQLATLTWEVDMKTSKRSYRISFAVAAVAATVSMGAHAEYRCATPAQLTNAERRACELAELDRPDQLRQFIERTSSIYGLHFYDYVSQRNVDSWDSARGPENAPSIRGADDRAKADRSN